MCRVENIFNDLDLFFNQWFKNTKWYVSSHSLKKSAHWLMAIEDTAKKL